MSKAKNINVIQIDDNELAELVNKLTSTARFYHDHQSLRERMRNQLIPYITVVKCSDDEVDK